MGTEIAVSIGLIAALLTAAKGFRVVAENTQFLPLISVALGIGLSFAFAGEVSPDLLKQGLIVGLSACGLYDVVAAKTANK